MKNLKTFNESLIDDRKKLNISDEDVTNTARDLYYKNKNEDSEKNWYDAEKELIKNRKTNLKKYWLLYTKPPYFETSLTNIGVPEKEKSRFINNSSVTLEDLVIISYDGIYYRWTGVLLDGSVEKRLESVGYVYQGGVDTPYAKRNI